MKCLAHLLVCAAAIFFPTESSFGDEQERPAKEETPRFQPRPAGVRSLAQALAAMHDTLRLIRNPAVKDEIKLTEEQRAQIDEAFQKMNAARRELPQAVRGATREERQKKSTELRKQLAAQSDEANEKIEKALRPEQLARIEQIAIQPRGLNVLSDAKIVKKLTLTEEQSRKIAVAQAEGLTKRQQLIREIRAGRLDRAQGAEKLKELQQQTEKNVMKLLTMEQQTRFNELRGEKFDFGGRVRRLAPVGAIHLKLEAKPLERKDVPKQFKEKEE